MKTGHHNYTIHNFEGWVRGEKDGKRSALVRHDEVDGKEGRKEGRKGCCARAEGSDFETFVEGWLRKCSRD